MIGPKIERSSPSARGLACLFAVVVTMAICFDFDSKTRADSAPAPRIRPLFVDADDPSAWPKGLEPISAAELERLLAVLGSQARQPAVIKIERATYRADFQDGRLEEGKAQLVLAQYGTSAGLLPLGDPNLGLTRPHWILGNGKRGESNESERALWGTDSTGRRVLIVEPGRSKLACDWSLAGRSLSDASEFNLALPPSVVSQLFLTVPDDWTVNCSAGVVTASQSSSRPGALVWQVDLGGLSSCRLRIERKAGSETKPALFVDQDTAYVVNAEKLQIQSKLQFDVYAKPVSTVSLLVPASLRVETISCADIPLPFKSHVSKEGQLIEVNFPEPLFGKSRPILVEASAASHVNQMWRLPRIDVPAATRRDGLAELTIANPLKLQQFGGDTATAQLEAPSYGADGEETFKLQNADLERPLLIKVGEPAPALTASMLERLDLLRDQCVLRCDVICSSSAGSAFSIECELPDIWDVTNVRAVGEMSRIIHWTSQEGAGPGRKRRVKIDFFRAITEREPQRFLLEAASRVPRTGETIHLPVPSFPGIHAGDSQTIITHSPAIDLALDPPEEFAPFSQGAIASGFASSSLLPDSRQTSEERIVVHRKTAANEKARITLRRGEQGFLAHVQATIDVEASQMSQRIAVSITPQTEPIERVFVYLTSEGPPTSWLLASERPRPVEVVLVASSRHSEWNLPIGGELWELRLPDPQRAPFRLESLRKTSSLSPGGIGLVYLPGARSFSGNVAVRFADPRQFLVEALGPQSVKPAEERRPADPRGENRVVRMWSYARPTDSLVLKPRQNGSLQTVAQLAALELHSSLDAGGSGDDLHRATFVIAPLSATRPFRFSLDSAARLTSVAVNNRIVRVQRHENAVTVPSLPADRSNRVEIVYRTSSTFHRFRERRTITIPRVEDAEIYQFRWTFALPAGIVPCGDPAGTKLLERRPSLSWSEKLFGPLGRPLAESPIPSMAEAPWMTDFGFESATRPDVFAEIDPDRPDPNWTVWHAMAQSVPRDLAVSVWHESEMRQLAWIVFFGSLSVGVVLQRLALRMRTLAALAIAALAASASFAAGGFYSLPLGGCVAGTLLSIVAWGPPLVRSAKPASKEPEARRPESTVTFEYRALVLLFALSVIGVTAVAGSDLPPIAATLNARHLRALPKVPTELFVVVPTRGGKFASDKALPDDARLVYVPQTELDALRQAANRVQQPGNYVFLSARYGVTFDPRQPVVVEARYEVAVVSPGETTIHLPLSNVTLAGAHACRVNDRLHPIRKTDDAFLLTLNAPDPNAEDAQARLPNDLDKSRQPVRALRPRPKDIAKTDHGLPETVPDDSAGLPRPQVFEIVLSFFPEMSGTTSTGFEFGLPRVAATLLQIPKPGLAVPMAVETDDGQVRKLAAGAASIVNVGETGWLRVAPDSPRPTAPAALEGRAVQFIRLSPDAIEMDCRASYAAVPGGVEEFEWTIPAVAVARALDDNFRFVRGTPTADGRWVPLKFTLIRKTDRPVTLGVRLMIPTKAVPKLGKPPHFMIPLVRFAGGFGAGTVKLLSNQVGVTAIAGYRSIVSTNEPNVSHTSAADPAFRQELRGAGRKEPEFIFESRGLGTLPVELLPLVPSYKVRISQEGRFSADRLSWKTTAEIRVENAPAFVHRLHVDPRLKIDSISIQEDNVERLVRYSRNGPDVTLFLRDRAAATQDLVLTGSMPVEIGRDTKLPAVSLVGATVSDARLLLEPGQQVDVTVINAPSQSSPLRPDRDEEHAQRRSREYLLAPDAPLPSVRVIARREPPHVESVTVLTPSDSHSVDIDVSLRVTGNRGEDEPLEVLIPDEIARHSTIAANVEKRIRQNGSGSISVLLETRQAVDPTVQVHWNQPQTSESWRIPSFSTTNAEISESLLFIANSLPWRPSSDSRIATQSASVPDWIRRRLSDGLSLLGWKSAAAGPINWDLKPTSTASSRPASARAFVNLSLAADGTALGSLYLLIEQPIEPMLTVRWPRGAVLRAALLDGRPIQPISERDGRLAFALGLERKVHRLALHWLRSGERSLGLATQVVEEFPVPVELEMKSVLLETGVPSQFRAVSSAGFQTLGPSLFADETKTIVTVSDQVSEDPSAGSEQTVAVLSPTPTRLLGRLDLERNFGAIQIWVYRAWLVTVPVAVAAFVLIVAALYWVSFSTVTIRLAKHQPVVLAILGAAWWAFLSPRVIGVAMVVVAMLWFARKRRIVEPRNHSRLPSTLHLPG
jgi:hypothetical protein